MSEQSSDLLESHNISSTDTVSHYKVPSHYCTRNFLLPESAATTDWKGHHLPHKGYYLFALSCCWAGTWVDTSKTDFGQDLSKDKTIASMSRLNNLRGKSNL
ncbi:uncharacterized protein [Dysidea avara]|uniref:uncharacterized protein n=1 Tax=Dysidea avara TaxID=196820 RepID=UPI003320BF8A